jgi:hypothetical protein
MEQFLAFWNLYPQRRWISFDIISFLSKIYQEKQINMHRLALKTNLWFEDLKETNKGKAWGQITKATNKLKS